MNFIDAYGQQPLTIIKGDPQLTGPMARILLIQLGDIGDLVLSIPTIQSLKENYPSAHLTVAACDKASDIMHLCPWCDDVIEIKKEKLAPKAWITKQYQFFRSLRSRGLDLAIDMRTGTRGGILSYLSGARIRMGFTALDDTWRNILFNHLVYPSMDWPMLHIAHYHLLLLDRYGLKVNSRWPRLHIDAQQAAAIENMLESEKVPLAVPLIAIQPFSLWRYKEWGRDHFRQLIQWLIRAYDVGVLICGTQAERSRAGQMIADIGGGDQGVRKCRGLLQRMRLPVGWSSMAV